MAGSTSVHEVLGTLLHSGVSDSVRDEATRLLSHDIFRPHSNLNDAERSSLIVQRLRYICEGAPVPNLVLDPERMLAYTAATAVVDPSLCVAMLTHFGLCLSFLEDSGSDSDWLQHFKDEIASGRTIGSFLITEIGHGNSHLAGRTEAVYDKGTDGFILHTPDLAAQKFMGGSCEDAVSRIGVVFARVIVDGQDRGSFPFMVELADESGPHPGIRMTTVTTDVVPQRCSLIEFDHVWLPRANWLSDKASIGANGEFIDPLESQDARLARSLSTGQNVWAGGAGALAAVSRVAVASALRFSTQRRTAARIGPALPVLDYSTQQRPLFSCLAEAMAISCLANTFRSTRIDLIKAWRRGERPTVGTDTMTWAPWASVHRDMAMAKVIAARSAERITRECRLRSGVLGTMAASRFLSYQSLGHMLSVAGGDNLLTILDTARTLVAQAADLPAPDPGLDTQGMSLHDAALWRELHQQRVSRLAGRIGDAMARLAPEGRDGFEAWNPRLTQVRELGEAYGESLILEHMFAAVDALPAGEGADVAGRLCAVQALEQLSRNATWYLCEGLVSVKQVQEIVPTLDELVSSLVPYTDDLVTAFAMDSSGSHALLLADDYVQELSATHSEP
ncbi:acyl-CoA dehydrogenase [Streptomyces shenzhenensis]|uniref:acyl-CoA dehydrogenase family protein n=1 Tax=Streptomyces shenzhenensis TaxID=943815 RepID=UPI00380156E7